MNSTVAAADGGIPSRGGLRHSMPSDLLSTLEGSTILGLELKVRSVMLAPSAFTYSDWSGEPHSQAMLQVRPVCSVEPMKLCY